ncbi:hypothetical protein BYT27DRAFT_7192445 [Phlegmacium glaucopus]|nr:hypothetical protein BYT27DRAFT_7192445 [Phlegmacium glaucopus]
MGVLEARQADYAKPMRDLKERRAESQSFLPKLQAKPKNSGTSSLVRIAQQFSQLPEITLLMHKNNWKWMCEIRSCGREEN